MVMVDRLNTDDAWKSRSRTFIFTIMPVIETIALFNAFLLRKNKKNHLLKPLTTGSQVMQCFQVNNNMTFIFPQFIRRQFIDITKLIIN